jgi:hypothetical protein
MPDQPVEKPSIFTVVWVIAVLIAIAVAGIALLGWLMQ